MSTTPPTLPPLPEFRYFKTYTSVLWKAKEGARPVWSVRGGPWNEGSPSVTVRTLASSDECFECDEHGTPLVPAPARGGEAITARGQCLHCHEDATLIGNGALCQRCADKLSPTPPPGATPVDGRDEVGKRIFKLRRQLGLADDLPDESVLCLAYDKIAASAAVAEGLEADKRRLDWVESLPAKAAFGKGPSGLFQFFDVTGDIAPPAPTFREAVDQALAAAALATGQQP